MKRSVSVGRTFQLGTGVGGKEFDWQYFLEIVAHQISSLLKLGTTEGVVVVINGDQKSPLSEIIDGNGKTPSVVAMEKTFPEEIANGQIVVHLCKNWGYSSALNEGIEIARNEFDTELVLTLSPEIEIAGIELDKAIEFMTEKKLSVLGFQREGWQVPRNTIALWDPDALEKIRGFSLQCDDIGKTVLIPKFGKVPLAGMEDYLALLMLLKRLLEMLPEILFKTSPNPFWGMFGDSLEWNVDFPEGSEREYRHLMKVARQEAVMKEYAKWIFPDLPYEQVMKALSDHCCYL
ncbi:MAG: hypothetical protein KAQ87_02275 [Candidatus Pacebacteria bacterium]|nr:hypothetical protein [Candidatus Paceibacterota bacterium]